jgi:hypothetical protein
VVERDNLSRSIFITVELSLIRSCSLVRLPVSPAQLDLSSYEGIMSGSRREDAESKGIDILGDGKLGKVPAV